VLKPDKYAGEDGIPLVRIMDVASGRVNQDSLEQISQYQSHEFRRTVVRAGELVISVVGTIGRAFIVPPSLEGANLSRALARVQLKPTMEARFLEFGFLATPFQSFVELVPAGTAQRVLNLGDLAEYLVAVPAPPEQRAIAVFLDRETARIDALVAKKERLIELLQEQRTALITRAVTKGLDPTVPMKDSGVEWLGEIPAHWDVKRLWHLTPSDRRIMYGIVLPGPNVDDGVPIVKGGDVAPERLRLERLNRTTREIESGYVRSRLRGGDLVYAIRGSIGEVAMVPDELEGANLTQDAARIAYTVSTHGSWLVHALKSSAVFAQLESGALGATIRGINIRDLKRASIAVPPRAEQRIIAAYLGRETARIDALVAKVRDAIERLKELRTAIISAAVTGKIDVREGVA
jgi:type I restriction enzyme S subunit